MTFTVTYRAKDGALREERVEAASRAECVAECRKRGIAPVGIREGRSGKSAASPRGADGRSGKSAASPKGRDGARPSRAGGTGDSKRTTARWVAAAVVIVAVAGGVWWWVGGRGGEPKTTSVQQQGAKPKVEKPKVAKPKTASVQQQGSEKPVAETNAVAVAPVATAPTGHVIKARSSRSGRVMTLADGTVVTNTPRAFFKRDFEHALHVALMPNGMGGTLLRQVRSRYTDEQILAMLKERVPVEPGDDDTTVAVKQKVQDFKDEVLRVVGEGASVSEVLDSMTRRKVEDGLLRARAHKVRTEALRSGDPETARQGIEAANAVLRENGLREMEVPQVLKASDGDAPQEKVSDESPPPALRTGM